MRTTAVVLAILFSTGVAFGQPANPNGGTPAISGRGNNPDAPVAGANSFTERQATSRIEAQGYTGVMGLKKDDKGIWRGSATKDGKKVEVSVDFQGNVVAQ
jgi:hypothetical protein